jgi:hypothetical protein
MTPLESSESDTTIWSVTYSRVILYDRNMFIIQATRVFFYVSHLHPSLISFVKLS